MEKRMEWREESLSEVTKRVCDYTLSLDFKSCENWENAIISQGLVALGDKEYVEQSEKIAVHAIKTQDSNGQLGNGLIIPGDSENVVQKWSGKKTITGIVHPGTLGSTVLYFYEKTKDEHFLEAANLQYKFLRESAPRTKKGGILHRYEAKELWLDTVWFIAPFIAKYGKVTGKSEAFDEAALQIESHLDYLLDSKTNLLRHIWCETPNYYPQTQFWSRGHGWVTAGSIDVYEYLPENHRGRKYIKDIIQVIFNALLKLQDKSGFWRNILDDKYSPLESSGTLMFCYSLRKAIDLGILKGDEYSVAADKAISAAKSVVTKKGGVGFCALPPGGPDARIGVSPHGQGWFILAAGRYLKLN